MSADSHSDRNDEWADRTHPIREHMALQRRTWTAERTGWCVLVLLLLLALAGLFAEGPLSSAKATDGSGRVAVEYERFERNGATARMTLTLTPDPTGAVQLRVSDSILRGFTIEAIRPEPSERRSLPDGLAWQFEAAESRPFAVHLILRAARLGPLQGEIGLADGTPPARLAFFIYP